MLTILERSNVYKTVDDELLEKRYTDLSRLTIVCCARDLMYRVRHVGSGK